MAKVSLQYVENARKNETTILHALADVGQNNVAERLGVSESTVSRLKSNGEIENMAALLATMGLKVVRQAAEVYEHDYIEALRTLAKKGL